MAATGTPTPNIGLRRPQGTDPASVDDINYNSNLIDTKMGPVGNTSVQEQINSLNSKLTQQNMFVKASGTINATSYTFDVPAVYCCGLFVTNINGVGNTIGYFKCDNGTVTIGRLDETSLHLNASYSDKKITFTNTAGTSIRDITIIIG